MTMLRCTVYDHWLVCVCSCHPSWSRWCYTSSWNNAWCPLGDITYWRYSVPVSGRPYWHTAHCSPPQEPPYNGSVNEHRFVLFYYYLLPNIVFALLGWKVVLVLRLWRTPICTPSTFRRKAIKRKSFRSRFPKGSAHDFQFFSPQTLSHRL